MINLITAKKTIKTSGAFLFLKSFNIVYFELGPLILMVAVADLPLGVDKAKYVSWLAID